MTKKFLVSILVAVILSGVFSVCFANEDNGSNNINLGNEITRSFDKTEDSAKNLVNGTMEAEQKMENGAKDMGQRIENGARDMGQRIENGARDMGQKIENGVRDVSGAVTENRNNYSTTRTTTSASINADNTIAGMTTNTWMWIIFAVAGIIILSAIWYYAVQNKDTKNN